MAARFGAYEILHELSSGGMGAVLLGRRRGPGTFEQLVAIKTIRPEYAGAEAVRAMFLDEAAILARINHPGIATVHDFGEDAGTLYMVMEYVAGVSFRRFAEHAPPPAVAARAIADACRGLHAAHEVRDTAGNVLGVVHRDISPDNLMLGYDGHVKVIDFGIALVKNRQAPVTELGTLKGKPPYMSPEQVKNEAMDRRSDVFSLGVVLHELLTGEPLFDGDSIYAIALAVEHRELRPPSAIVGRALPPGLDAAVMAALDRDLARRTPTAAAFAEQLEQVIAQTGDETLEAWAERELATPRADHRAWLARVVIGDAAVRVGRATGAVTALGPLAHVDTLPRPPTPVPAPPEPAPAPTTEDDLDRPPRRSLLLPLLALVLLGGLAIGIAVLVRGGDPAATPDAAVVVLAADATLADTVVDVAIVVDAIELDAAVPDAFPPIDARRRPPPDARVRSPVDAAPAVVARPDAAVVPTGTGALIVKHHPASPSYVEVRIDGVTFGRTPILRPKPLAAGAHVLTLVKPNTDEVVYKTPITVHDGETLTIVQPTPHQ